MHRRLVGQLDRVYSDDAPYVNARVYGYLPVDAANDANANVPRFFRMADVLRAAVALAGWVTHSLAVCTGVPAATQGANRATSRPAIGPRAIIIIPKDGAADVWISRRASRPADCQLPRSADSMGRNAATARVEEGPMKQPSLWLLIAALSLNAGNAMPCAGAERRPGRHRGRRRNRRPGRRSRAATLPADKSKSRTKADVTAATRPAKELSADEMLSQMLKAPQQTGARPLPPLPSAASGGPDKTSGTGAVAAAAPVVNVLREGTFLVDRVGRLSRNADGTRLEFAVRRRWHDAAGPAGRPRSQSQTHADGRMPPTAAPTASSASASAAR